MFAIILLAIKLRDSCPFGISGKNLVSNGDNLFDNFFNNPEISAILVIPIQRASTGNILNNISKLTLVLSTIVLLILSTLFVNIDSFLTNLHGFLYLPNEVGRSFPKEIQYNKHNVFHKKLLLHDKHYLFHHMFLDVTMNCVHSQIMLSVSQANSRTL